MYGTSLIPRLIGRRSKVLGIRAASYIVNSLINKDITVAWSAVVSTQQFGFTLQNNIATALVCAFSP